MKNQKIWSFLVHLSGHMWDDENTPPRSWYSAPRYTESNNVSVKAWDDIVQFLAECRYNMLIVDVGDAIPSRNFRSRCMGQGLFKKEAGRSKSAWT